MIRDKTAKTTSVQESLKKNTHVGLDVLVLEVERVLPDVDADDRDMAEERVLVRRRRDLNDLRGGVPALYGRAGQRESSSRSNAE